MNYFEFMSLLIMVLARWFTMFLFQNVIETIILIPSPKISFNCDTPIEAN